jgi:hypothetical protein
MNPPLLFIYALLAGVSISAAWMLSTILALHNLSQANRILSPDDDNLDRLVPDSNSPHPALA